MSKVNVATNPQNTKTNANDEPEFNKAGSYISNLSILDSTDYQTAEYPKPLILGSFGVFINRKTMERRYTSGRAYIKYLSLPSSYNFDLNEGFDEEIKYSASHDLDVFLRWIIENKNKILDETELFNLGVDFISYRGTLSKIMVTPYEANQDWLIYAIKYNNTIYLRQDETELYKTQNQTLSLDAKKFSHSGNRFEGYVCIYSDPKIIDSSLFSHQFCCVFKSRINSHSFLISAEVDCVENKDQAMLSLENMNFIEVKTCSRTSSFKNVCKYKMLKWWAQCSLAGVENIVCGYRDANMKVDSIHDSIHKYSLNKIINLGERYWSSNVCLNFLDNFLTFLKNCVSEENVLYSFYCCPKVNIICRKEIDAKCEVIPDWYKNNLFN